MHYYREMQFNTKNPNKAKHLKQAVLGCQNVLLWLKILRCFKASLFSHYSYLKKKCNFAIFWLWQRLKIFKCQTSWRDKKVICSPQLCHRVVMRERMERCAGGAMQEKGAVPEREERRKQHLWKHLRAMKKWAEILKHWARGEKVSDDEVKIAPAINVCYALRAFSAG